MKKDHEKEIDFIRNEMKDNLLTRNTLMTFCFTAVITTIGFGLTNFDTIPCTIYLIPIIITIIFSCRITYYKDKQCRMNAYLNVFYRKSIKFKTVFSDNPCIGDFLIKNKFLSIIINNELLGLSIICTIIYYIKFDLVYEECNIIYIIMLILPIILCFIHLRILLKVPSYTQKSKEYADTLKSHLKSGK